MRLACSKGISAAGYIDVIAIRILSVIGMPINSFVRKGWPCHSTFGGVVIDNIHDHFNSSGMKLINCPLQFSNRIVSAGICTVWGRKQKCVVTPMVYSTSTINGRLCY